MARSHQSVVGHALGLSGHALARGIYEALAAHAAASILFERWMRGLTEKQESRDCDLRRKAEAAPPCGRGWRAERASSATEE